MSAMAILQQLALPPHPDVRRIVDVIKLFSGFV
jgi:hypothetical protein